MTPHFGKHRKGEGEKSQQRTRINPNAKNKAKEEALAGKAGSREIEIAAAALAEAATATAGRRGKRPTEEAEKDGKCTLCNAASDSRNFDPANRRHVDTQEMKRR